MGEWFAGHRGFARGAASFREAGLVEPISSRYRDLPELSLSSSGNAKDAIAELQQSTQVDRSSVPSHLARAATFERLGRRTDAETEWRLALAQDPASELALSHLTRDLLADGSYSAVISLLGPREAAGSLPDELVVSLSVAYTKSGLLQNASDLLSSALRAHPASFALAEGLAGVLMLQSRFQEAVRTLAPFVKQKPEDLATQILYFHTLVLAHDPDANALGERLLIRAPHQWEVLYLMGLLRQQSDDAAAAKRYLSASVAANPGYPDTHYRLGVALARLKDDSGAKEQLQQAIALGLQDPEVHFELARVLRATGDRAGAEQQIAVYQKLLKAQADRAQAADEAQQADQAEISGNLQQAVADYRSAVALDPAEPVLAYKLAMALDQARDRAGERAALEQVIRLKPGMAMAQNQLGYLDNSGGDTDAAIQHFRLAVEADPSYTRAWMNLGAALCLQSRWREARGALGHVLALDPSDASAKDLLQRIAQLQ